jgi:hypothetical protein
MENKYIKLYIFLFLSVTYKETFRGFFFFFFTVNLYKLHF